MRRSRSAPQLAVMLRRSCSRCRTRRRSSWFALWSGVAFSSTSDESELTRMGTPSVPKISSGSRSRLEIRADSEIWSRKQKGETRKEQGLLPNGALFRWQAASRLVLRPVLAFGLVLLRLLALVRHGRTCGFLSRMVVAEEDEKAKRRSENVCG